MKKRGTACTANELGRSACPIANTLNLIGDKWTLLVIRDLLFLGKRLYGELMQSAEGYPSNILADRLKRLEDAGLLEKHPYQHNPVRYEYHLTAKGTDMFPILREMILWGNKHIEGTTTPPPGFLDHFAQQIVGGRKKTGRKKG
ncbi:MAG: helix-turn-helix transcriptional regulator [Gammaproteobacteria bacterium]|nr:helix-turn-helix transcriptional regulator [Gammaproteobacteria bacterium]